MNRYLFVGVEFLMYYCEAFSIPDNSAKTITDKILKIFICKYVVTTNLNMDD